MTRRRVRELFSGLVGPLVAAAFLACAASSAEAQLVSYDDFVGPALDETKWAGRLLVRRDGGTGAVMEIQREVTPAQTLMLQTRAVGGRASDTGTFAAENALAFRRANTLTDIAFTVWVRELGLAGCAAGADSAAAAGGQFALFNDGDGDVVAAVEVRRSSASTGAAALEVTASLIHRRDGEDTVIGVLPLGTAELEQRVRLRVRWERARSRVRFQRDAEPLVAVDYTNVVDDTPDIPLKSLGVVAEVGDCSSAGSSASIVALFNNVRVNP